MWLSRISSKGRNAQPSRQQGGILFWAIIILIGAAIGAFLAFEFVLKKLEAKLLVTDEKVTAYVDQPLGVKATVLNDLKISIDEQVSTVVPVDTNLSVPVEEPLNLVAHFDAMVPISTVVPVNDVIPLEQEIEIDTIVEADLLGETFLLPLRGRFPVKAEVPISLIVPIDKKIHMQFSAPIKASLRQNLEVPLKTKIAATVPLKTEMTVPVLNNLEATAVIPRDPHLPVTLNYADLRIQLNKMRFERTEETRYPPIRELISGFVSGSAQAADAAESETDKPQVKESQEVAQ